MCKANNKFNHLYYLNFSNCLYLTLINSQINTTQKAVHNNSIYFSNNNT